MAHATGEVAVRIRGLGKSLGGREVLRDIDLTVPAGGVTSLIGGSGSGKSVLMKHVLGLFRPDRGSIEVLGVDLGPLSDDELRTLRTRMGMLFQGAALFDSLTVEENVRCAVAPSALPTSAIASRRCSTSSTSSTYARASRGRSRRDSESASRLPARWSPGLRSSSMTSRRPASTRS
jgi:ABC-type transporter Mla maintaining outer membrane lipid asymmetry ATPase subunit MlaF